MGHDDVPSIIETWRQYEAGKDRMRALIDKGPGRSLEESSLMTRLAQAILDYERRTMSPIDFIM
jgi:hypothetical protein